MKKRLRQEMKERLAAMSPGEIADRSHAACERLMSLAEFVEASAVMLYLPTPAEIDPSAAALHAWQAGKTVLVPWVDWDHNHMLAVKVDTMDDCETGRHGVRQPPAGPAWPEQDIDFIVVPALAYDVTGRRLGRGGGFYDRFLATPDLRAVTCGLAFDVQMLDDLPADEHDRPVDLLVTDRQTIDARKQRAAVDQRQG
jgi:5-formyltetrahydrofolate cyclo-ligase